MVKRIGIDPKEILDRFQRAAREIGLNRRELNLVIREIWRAKR